jgi:hypothetical protein
MRHFSKMWDLCMSATSKLTLIYQVVSNMQEICRNILVLFLVICCAKGEASISRTVEEKPWEKTKTKQWQNHWS